eukprot:m.397210 g.397210  ORF g.397210 m.397210 type:complete len:173 (-) comp21126_c0_seq2:75-593(-)
MDDEQERIVSECMPTESITAAGAVSTRFASRAPTQIQQHRGAADALWTSGGRRCNMGCCHTCVPGGTDVTWHRLHGYSSSDEDSSSLSLSSLSSELSSVAGEGVYDCSGQRSSQLVRSYSAALCVNSTSLGLHAAHTWEAVNRVAKYFHWYHGCSREQLGRQYTIRSRIQTI